MIQSQQWKMAVNHSGIPYMLYNLEQDPDEQHNLIGTPEAEQVVPRLSQRMMERLVSSQNSPNFQKIT